MNKRQITVIAGTMLAAAAMIAPGTPAAAATVRPAVSCIWNPTRNSHTPGHFTGTGINIRTGPGTSCTAVGQGNPSQSLTLRCAATGQDGATWFYLTDNATGKTGWSRGNYVTYVGGVIFC